MGTEMANDFERLRDRLLSWGHDARIIPLGLADAIFVLGCMRDASSGAVVSVRVLWIDKRLNGSWRTWDAVEKDVEYNESEIADYVERRLTASQEEFDAESKRRFDSVRGKTPPDLNLPHPVFRVGGA
jgi:hypothetical protein